jgi:hypothetical protein
VSAEDLFDFEAEQTLVGWMLARPDHWHLVTEIVTPTDLAEDRTKAAFVSLASNGYQTVQQIAGGTNVWSRAMGEWAETARLLPERVVTRTALRVANLALRRRLHRDAYDAIDDATNLTLDEGELIARARERIDRVEAPDAPPEDPALPVDQFMAGPDDDYEWVIDGLLERRDRMLVTATGGVGKSTLLRQIALATAAGIDPFTREPLSGGPKRVLLLDLENSARQVRRKLRGPLGRAGEFDPDRLRIAAHPKVVDITTGAGWRWLAGQATLARPDLIVGGPVYRMYHGGDASKDMGGRDRAVEVAAALDRLRDRHGCALVLEAHPPKGSLSLSPHGSAVWEWWPEFGVGLAPSEGDVNFVELRHWRFPRDDREFPQCLARGGALGFSMARRAA